MQYAPYNELGDRPNVIVDGAANANTVMTLSHWPNSATPDELKDDLSAQIVFHYLDRPDLRVNADIVSNNHFDEDGLVGIYALLNPSAARDQRMLLIDVAAAGDFGTYRFRKAARVAFVLGAFAQRQLSPLAAAIFSKPYPAMAACLYQEMLPRISDIVTNLDQFRAYWEMEDAALTESEAMINAGKIQIEEIPSLDLAVVKLPESSRSPMAGRSVQNPRAACHPMALHNAIEHFRVLQMQGRTYELQYRYESWVQYVSRRPLPRVDLTPLAHELSGKEAGGGAWIFEGVDQITPKLALTGAEESRIPPEQFLETVKAFLAAPAAGGLKE